MKKLATTIYCLLLFIYGLHAQVEGEQLKHLYKLAGQSKNWHEGFAKNIGDNTFNYHSFRNDVSDALLTRCKGSMPIEWETAALPDDWNDTQAGFLWIAAMDLTNKNMIFDLYVNDVKRFEIHSSQKKHWEISTQDGGTLSFISMETDQHGDAHGYMSLVAPAEWLTKGQAQRIKIIGRDINDNTWIIIYQVPDALAYFQNSIEHDMWMEITIEEKDKQLQTCIKAPFILAGKSVHYSVGNSKDSVILLASDDFATADFMLPLSAWKKPFYLNDPRGELVVIKSLGENFKSSMLLAKAVLLNESKTEGNTTVITAQRSYKPKTVASLLELSNSILVKGRILLMNSSHQDIAWMDTPEKCVIERDTMLLSPLFEKAGKDHTYRFDVEDALMIKEYLERHPEDRELVQQLLDDGRISCGSSYIQPYEEMYSGEALARQFYFGAKWLKDEFDYNATVYWNEDVPGRTPQMSQLLRKAGTKYMMISRHERGIYNWFSPDGSYVSVFTPGHYADAFTSLQKNFHEAAQYIASSTMDWEVYYSEQTTSPVMPLLSDWDMSPANDYSHLIQQWEDIDELQNEEGKYVSVQLPQIQIVSAPEFFEALIREKPQLQAIKGERPNPWLYIHGPAHQKALKASRSGDILLTQAEKFATANALVAGSFINYPQQQLSKAWEAKIYPDHGWGGKGGEITDALFLQKYEYAKSQAEEILSNSLNQLVSRIKTKSRKGRALVVFNSMNYERNDPVQIAVSFEKTQAFDLELKDADGNLTALQYSDVEYFADGSIRSAQLHFTAENMPPIGYKTYYLKPTVTMDGTEELEFSQQTENNFYKLKFANGGLESIYDKELQTELINPEKFVAGEVFTMHSEGHGAGEFSDVQQPDMQGFDKTGNYQTNWEIEEQGLVFTVYMIRQKIRNAVVEQRIKLFHQQKRIDFDLALLNWEGELYREFRMALPLNMNDGQVAYEVPFGVVEVGKDELQGAAGERYTTPCSDIHPRSIENWIGASNTQFGITLSSTVVAADWIDPTNNSNPYQILQPILLASRKSCHGEGNEYLQTGDHYFNFSFTSHKTGWENGMQFGRQANEELHAVWADHTYKSAKLPESMSFFHTDNQKLLISTIKKAEDSDAVVLRLVDMEGKDKEVQIHSFFKLQGAWHTNLIEDEIRNIETNGFSFPIKLGHHAIETYMIDE